MAVAVKDASWIFKISDHPPGYDRAGSQSEQKPGWRRKRAQKLTVCGCPAGECRKSRAGCKGKA
jgi:hypothetical protein